MFFFGVRCTGPQALVRIPDPLGRRFLDRRIGNAGLTRLGLPLGVGLVTPGVTASVIAPALLRRRGTVETTVWVVHVACDRADSSLVAVRVPPLCLQVDDREGGAGVAVVKEPDALSVVPVCAKPAAAIMFVFESFGTIDDRADFDFDGVVGAGDVVRILERY
jgi:hypothetical protein